MDEIIVTQDRKRSPEQDVTTSKELVADDATPTSAPKGVMLGKDGNMLVSVLGSKLPNVVH